MKKACISLLAALVAVLSCSRDRQRVFENLDSAIKSQPVYDSAYVRKNNGLRALFLDAETDSVRWERAYDLERILYYHDVDSCYRYIREMRRLQRGDARQKAISESCYANILYKMDSTGTALRVLRQIDTTGMGAEALDIYCFAGYHIYGRLAAGRPEFAAAQQAVVEKWWRSDSTRIECAFYYNELHRKDGTPDEAVARLKACSLNSVNDTAKANYFLAKESLYNGDTGLAIQYFANSAACDMRLSVKAYNALYELARILFRTGDIERADRYMRITLKDAYSSHYESRYEDVIRSEMEIMNVLLRQQEQKKRAYLLLALAAALLLSGALVSVYLLSRYSTRLNRSRMKLNELSSIKDNFLAYYMEKCVDYLNKVDQYRSSLRQTARTDGQAAVMAMLRKPSFADSGFQDLLNAFDSTFLGIFPDFVERVNEHMQEPYRLSLTDGGALSTELRILALIRISIPQRRKIAKVLNMSVTTVYSYHSLLQKHSLHPDASFDRIIANL